MYLAGCGSDLSEQRRQAQELTRQIKEREEQRDILKDGSVQRKARLADLDDLTGDCEKRNQQLQAMIQEKTRTVTSSKQELVRIENEVLQSREEAASVKKAVDECLLAVNAQQLALRHSRVQKADLDQLLDRHRDMLLGVVSKLVALKNIN